MMDKKKMLILGAVVVVVLGVGAFTMLGGDDSSASKTTHKSKKSHSKSEKPKSDEVATASGTEGQEEVVKTDLNVGGLDFRGGKAPADSKNSGSSKTNVAPNNSNEPSESTMRQGAPVPLAIRDPFAVPPEGIAKKKDSKESKMPMAGTGAPAVASATVNPSSQNPGSQGNASSVPSAPLSPMPAPMPGPMTGGAGATQVAPGASAHGSVAAKITPGKAAFNSEELPYSVSGVVMGDNPIGVVSDADGGQRMVRVGSKMGTGRVIRITRGAIFVEFNGKVKALKVGGGSGTVQKKQAHAGDPERTGAQ